MKIEIRAANEAVIEGYVNAVGRDSRKMRRRDGKLFIERVEPGAFGKALQNGKSIEVRLNHSTVLGSTGTGELSLREDSIGLYAKAHISDERVIEKARKKELRGWSFGFVKQKDEWEDAGEGLERRKLTDIELREVSILDCTPAYIATSIELRGESGEMLEERFLEEDIDVEDRAEKETESDKEPDTALCVRKKEIEILEIGG